MLYERLEKLNREWFEELFKIPAPRRRELTDLATPLAMTVLLSDRWVIRSTQSVKMIDRELSRIRFIRQILLPPPGARAMIDGSVVLPALLVRSGVDARIGRTVPPQPLPPPLTEGEGKLLTLAMIDWVGTALLGKAPPPAVLKCLAEALWDDGDPDERHERLHLDLAKCGGEIRTMKDDDTFARLLRAACDGYFYFLLVDPEYERQTLTVELEAPLPEPEAVDRQVDRDVFKDVSDWWLRLMAWKPRAFRMEIGADYAAGTDHVEIRALEGISFGSRWQSDGETEAGRPGRSPGNANFLLRTNPDPDEAPFIAVHIHPGDSAMLRGFVPGFAITLLLAVLAIAYWAWNPGPTLATSLLLLPASALPLLVVARGEHPYVTEVVRGLRFTVLSLALWAVMAATALVAFSAPRAKAISLTFFAILELLSSIVLLVTYLRNRVDSRDREGGSPLRRRPPRGQKLPRVERETVGVYLLGSIRAEGTLPQLDKADEKVQAKVRVTCGMEVAPPPGVVP